MSEFDWPGFLPAFAAEASQQGFAIETLGNFPGGPLTAFERAAAGPRVYLSAGIHGDEPAGPLALLELLRSRALAPEIHWMICPALNPGGLAGGLRENLHGIDLNRDYWTRATAEVASHARWLEARQVPDLFISLHEDWETSGFYLYEINLGSDHPPRVRAVLDAIKPWFAPEPGFEIDGHLARELGWIFHAAEADLPEAWPEAIFLSKMGCELSFTLETPSRAPLADRVAAHVAGVRVLCAELAASPGAE
jgi:murein peptide amidase A